MWPMISAKRPRYHSQNKMKKKRTRTHTQFKSVQRSMRSENRKWMKRCGHGRSIVGCCRREFDQDQRHTIVYIQTVSFITDIHSHTHMFECMHSSIYVVIVIVFVFIEVSDGCGGVYTLSIYKYFVRKFKRSNGVLRA